MKILNQPELQKIRQPDAVCPYEGAKHRQNSDKQGSARPAKAGETFAEKWSNLHVRQEIRRKAEATQEICGCRRK
jgi:hypothetical protein